MSYRAVVVSYAISSLALLSCTSIDEPPPSASQVSLTAGDCEARALEFRDWVDGLEDRATGEPASAIDAALAQIDQLADLGDRAVAFARLFELTVIACPQLEEPMAAISYAAAEDKLRLFRDGLESSLQDCDCALGLAEAKAFYYRVWRGFGA